MAKLGLKGFSAGIDKGWDLIPDRFFHPDTYKPGKKQKQQTDQKDAARKSRRNSEPGRRDSDRRAAAAAGAGAAGGAAAAEAYQDDNDDDDDDSDRDRRRRSRRRRSSNQRSRYDEDADQAGQQNNPPHPYDQYAGQGYAPQDYAAQGYQQSYQQPTQHNSQVLTEQHQGSVQGDPNFPYNQKAQAQAIQPQNTQQTYNPYATTQFGQMGDNRFPPPPTGGAYQQSHGYNPTDYQPRDGYSPSVGGAGYNDRYAPARYEQDSYLRPGDSDRHDRYSDDYDRRSDDRHGRDRSRSKRRSHKSRDHSQESGNPMKTQMNKHLDGSERGLTTGAIGALAGGIVGNKFGKGPIATVAGVLIGGIGANAWEAHEHKNKESRRDKKEKSSRRAKSTSGRMEPYEGRDSGRGGYEYDSAEESDDSYNRRKREKKERGRASRDYSRDPRDDRDQDYGR